MPRWISRTSEGKAAIKLCLDLANAGVGGLDRDRWRIAVAGVRDQHAEGTPAHGALVVLAHVLESRAAPVIAAAVGELWQALGCAAPPRPSVPSARILESCLTKEERAHALDAAAAFPSALSWEERKALGVPMRSVELYAMAGHLEARAEAERDPVHAAYLAARARLHHRAAAAFDALFRPD